VSADDDKNTKWVQDRLRKRFPVEALNKARKDLDPNGILSNKLIDQLFPKVEVEGG
jgi:L-galactono-1,4-lactone dehydrogenase